MERSLAELVRHTHDEVEFHVVATTLAPELRELVRWTRVRVPQTPVPLFFSAFYARAGALLGGIDADLVHSMGALHPRSSDLVSVQFCHAAFQELPADVLAVDGGPLRAINRRVDMRLALAAERHAYRRGRVREFAAASSGIRSELARFYPAIPCTVIPNGHSDDGTATNGARGAVRARAGFREDDVVVLFLGGDWHRKGLGIALEGFAQAVEATGSERLRFAVVGPGEPQAHRTRARELGIADRVAFLGPTSEPRDHFAAADAFVFPTAYEAFPLVALEAAAAGLPIIATRVNGIEDLVDDGVSGYLVDRTPAAVGQAIRRITSDESLRTRMGAAATASAAAYSWSAAAERTLTCYSRLLSAGRRA